MLKAYVPTHYSESSSPIGGNNGGSGLLPICSDTIDNDKDGLIDEKDPNCHIDGDLLKAYVPTHYSESSSPIGFGDEGLPDLIAGRVAPTTTIINTPTTLSSVITNIGEGSTAKSFSSYFTISATRPAGIENEPQPIENNNVSKSGIKLFFAKILNKIPWISKAMAVNFLNQTDIQLKYLTVTIPTLPTKTGNVATVSYSFAFAKTYYIRACADKSGPTDMGTITELNEDNNCGSWTALTVTNSLPTGGDLPVCSDGLDNDNDGKIDILDPGCHIDGDLMKDYVPTHYSELIPPGDNVTQCNDGIDNDNDNKIDSADTGCHIDGDLNKEYVSTHDSEKNPPTNDKLNECLLIKKYPLVFSEEQKAKLAVLLRKFYLLAPSLKTDDDIVSIYSEIDQYRNLMTQIEGLTNQCKSQVAAITNRPAGWNHLDQLRGNPWYRINNNGTFPYGGNESYFDYNVMEWNKEKGQGHTATTVYKNGTDYPDSNEGACPLVSGYYYGTDLDGKDCAIYTPPGRCWAGAYTNLAGNDLGLYPNKDILKLGCKWQEGIPFMDVERILNIW